MSVVILKKRIRCSRTAVEIRAGIDVKTINIEKIRGSNQQANLRGPRD